MVVLGMEVPFLSNDSLKWVEASVPVTRSAHSNTRAAPPTQDYASYSIIQIPYTYLIWRICKQRPHAIEILEVLPDKEIPRVGLRILFPEALSPFAYMCENNKITCACDSVYLLYALSISGTAYFFQLKNISAYASSYVFSTDEFLHLDTKISPNCPSITAAAATAGRLVVGRNNGSFTCFHLSDWYNGAQIVQISSSRPSESVKELVISKICSRNVLFALYSDGCLQVWDLSSWVKLLSKSLKDQYPGGAAVSRLSVGVAGANVHRIHLVFLHTNNTQWDDALDIVPCVLNFPPGGRWSLSFMSADLLPRFHLPKKKPVDVKLSSDKIWILQENTLWELDLCVDSYWDLTNCSYLLGAFIFQHSYSLQEAYISKQLFQDSEQSLDAFYQTTCLMFSTKEQRIGFISSIFLHRLLQPVVYSSSVFRSTLKYYDKHWTDHEFQALTIDGLRRETLLLIQDEAINGSPLSALKCWKKFCLRYFNQWRKSSARLGLLVDSHSGAVGLIRQNTVSLVRSLGDSELLMHGTNFEELQNFPWFNFDASVNDDLECEILLKVRSCIRSLNRELGPAISPAIFYELIGGALLEDGVPHLLKDAKCEYNTSRSGVAFLVSQLLGADFVWHKRLKDHRIGAEKFLFSMFLSLEALHQKTHGWNRILNVIKRYLSFLVPQKQKTINPCLKSDAAVFNAKIPIIVQATSQVAGLMFQSALDVFLFLSYLLEISSQVQMLPDDMSRLQLELIPMITDIISEWLIIHFLSSMPSDSQSADYFSSELSSPRINHNSEPRTWTQNLGSVDFTLAFVLLLDGHDSTKGCNYWSLSSLPNPGSLTNLVRHFISWLCTRSLEKPLYDIEHANDLALSLLKCGQYNAIEVLLKIARAHSRCKKLFENIQIGDGEWCVLHHLTECCLSCSSPSEPL